MQGCGGCRRLRRWWRGASAPQANNKKQDKKKESQEAPFDIRSLRVFPLDRSTGGANLVKPNHVAEGVWEVRSNRRNLSGWLEAELLRATSEERLPLPGSRYYLSQARRVTLPKGQIKRFALPYFVAVDNIEKRVAIRHQLEAKRGGQEIASSFDPVTLMPPHQFIIAVLADNSDRYGFLKSIESTRQPVLDVAMSDPDIYYRIVLTETEPRVGLPSSILAWTSIAHLIWDRLDPDKLSEDQRQALVDWLHWGGQIIISGPGSLESLGGSFLEPYLPAVAGEAHAITNDDLERFNRTFALREAGQGKWHRLEVPKGSKLPGVRLQLNSGGRFVPGAGELVAERRVGRGRIVVTGFPLSDRLVINWRGFDSFMNGCLLGRPPRQFVEVDFQPAWRFADSPRRVSMTEWTREPLLHSGLRFFSRDVGQSVAILQRDQGQSWWRWDGSSGEKLAGVAGWNDGGAVSSAALESLHTAAGIDIPEADFVLRSVALYLLVLVPLNWLVFRLFKRVEWAWAAIPVIAIVGAVLVVRAAQLDIGFARSRTEVGVLEFHAGYPRAHLSRFVSIYTSLTTEFTVSMDDPHALARPISTGEDRPVIRYLQCRLTRGDETRLEGFQVESNSSDTLHSEQFIAMGGPCQLEDGPQGMELINRSKLALRGVGVLRRDEGGRLQQAWVGRLDPGQRKTLDFHIVPQENRADPWFPQWNGNPRSRRRSTATSGAAAAQLSLAGLLQVAMRNLALRRGESRMVGWVDGVLPGITLDPPIAQTAGATLVVGHLQFAPPPPPQPDRNLLIDLVNARRKAGRDADAELEPDREAP